MRWILGLIVMMSGAASLAVGCGSESDETEDKPAKESVDQVYPEAVGPALSEMKPGWNTLLPGGETICSKGEPFQYFVRPGATDKVVIEFSGGGACWSDKTCPLADAAAIFTSTVEPPNYVSDESKAKGISDHSRDDNPVKDWTHVYIGYCTGDIHVGDNVKTYTDANTQKPLTINHKGAANTRAVLAWVFKNFTAPQQVLVTGCSAGGYGATFWAPHIKRHYTSAKIFHLSDSAAGIVSPSFFSDLNEAWKPQGVYPKYIPGSDPSIKASLSSYYLAVSNFYPDLPMAQFNTAFDATQALYFNFVTNQDEKEWSKLMLNEISAIRDGAKNFGAYLAPGDKHCVIPDDDFYASLVDGKSPAAWLQEEIQNEKAADITCEKCK